MISIMRTSKDKQGIRLLSMSVIQKNNSYQVRLLFTDTWNDWEGLYEGASFSVYLHTDKRSTHSLYTMPSLVMLKRWVEPGDEATLGCKQWTGLLDWNTGLH